MVRNELAKTLGVGTFDGDAAYYHDITRSVTKSIVQTSSTTTTCLISRLVVEHSCSLLVVVKHFMPKLTQRRCELIGTKMAFTSTYHPQTDRMVERFNRMLSEQHLAAFRDGDGSASGNARLRRLHL